MHGFVDPHGLGNHPEAELLGFQSSFAIRDHRVEEVVLRLVEETKMCSPGHLADDVDSALPQLGRHRGLLSVFTLRNRCCKPISPVASSAARTRAVCASRG